MDVTLSRVCFSASHCPPPSVPSRAHGISQRTTVRSTRWVARSVGLRHDGGNRHDHEFKKAVPFPREVREEMPLPAVRPLKASFDAGSPHHQGWHKAPACHRTLLSRPADAYPRLRGFVSRGCRKVAEEARRSSRASIPTSRAPGGTGYKGLLLQSITRCPEHCSRRRATYITCSAVVEESGTADGCSIRELLVPGRHPLLRRRGARSVKPGASSGGERPCPWA